MSPAHLGEIPTLTHASGLRVAIFASPLHELTGFYLAVDCLAPVQRPAHLCRGRARNILQRGQHRASGVAPDALLQRLWRSRGGRRARDLADPSTHAPDPGAGRPACSIVADVGAALEL